MIAPSGNPGLVNAFYLAWTIPLAGAMGLSLFSGVRYRRSAKSLIA